MKVMKKGLAGIVLMLALLMLVPVTAKADGAAPVCAKRQTMEIYICRPLRSMGMTGAEGWIYIGNLAKDAEVYQVRSSNSNFQARKEKGINGIYVESKPHVLKAGERTRISFMVYQNGRSYRLYCDVTFKNMKRKFKAFKMGSREYDSSFKGFSAVSVLRFKSQKIKVKATPAKGYKVDCIIAEYTKNGRNVLKKYKNGSNVSLKNIVCLDVVYHTKNRPRYYKRPDSTYVSTNLYLKNYMPSPLYSKLNITFY